MRHGIRPVSRPVAFRDRASGFQPLTRSTIESRHTVEWEDGATYPVVDVEISSAGHPFLTGTSRLVDSAGRVERFERRHGTAAARR
ncbi:type B 50S ribosomal protein L31 [Streptomyces sp. YIM B13518]|uniref:type B 50S ribosomal protein L31 n=1 Tax=Streptomyces sp. YIM B13518 TaxID=3366316 RepID=UPI00369E2F09